MSRILFSHNSQAGNTAEFYLDHSASKTVLTHEELLRAFEASESRAHELLKDQGYFSI